MPPRINVDAQVVLLVTIIENKGGQQNWEQIGQKLGMTGMAARLRYARIKAEIDKETNEKTLSSSASATTTPTKKRKPEVSNATAEQLISSPTKMRSKKMSEPGTSKKSGQKKSNVKKEVFPNLSDEEDY